MTTDIIELLSHQADSSADDGYKTTLEIARAMGWSRQRVLDKLAEFKSQGVLETRRVKRERIDGMLAPVAGYRIRLSPDLS